MERRRRTLRMYHEYESGRTIAEIARKYRLSPQAVAARFRKLGLAVTAANTVRSENGRSRQCAAAQLALTATTVPELRAVLELRVQHPDLTLADLAAKHDPPLTKSAYWSRLRRALRAADDTSSGDAGADRRPRVASTPSETGALPPSRVASQDETTSGAREEDLS
ncbi:helix-turn-helix domain-containing protein [Mycolicibacterium goodii]|uniref:helix-turn-helix domain-containing protein n=1 Tax=Mycolicibacterium goodii TaxID=134601 RepID=UPI002265B5F9|nr:helix-turn-helix domain-containing protein [Mycolicibacterium goodii]